MRNFAEGGAVLRAGIACRRLKSWRVEVGSLLPFQIRSVPDECLGWTK